MSGGLVSALIAYAYDLPDFQIVGGPDWIRTERFDVDAKAASAQPRSVTCGRDRG
jgi:uncharacterized protein (TIGR03435 family)